MVAMERSQPAARAHHAVASQNGSSFIGENQRACAISHPKCMASEAAARATNGIYELGIRARRRGAKSVPVAIVSEGSEGTIIVSRT
jgi:hypothetical protein